MNATIKPTVITWDYREQPDWEAINFALVEHWSAFIHPVETGTDQFGIVIGPREMSEQDAQKRYEERYDLGT